MIPYGRQWISDDDVAAVTRVLRSDWLTQGPHIAEFESAVARRVGAKHAIAVANGTAALHLAALAAGMGPGEVLWTSPITFVASANCARYAGGEADFVDVDPATALMDVDALDKKLAAAAAAGRLPRALVPVHLGGQPCDMDRIGALARRHGITVIEDAAHAIGGRFGDRAVGACEHSDMTVFSFHPVKLITTGEGGMITTHSDALAARLRLLRTHGITRDPAGMAGTSEGAWYYEQVDLGFNYRITDFQCALGLRQLERLDEFLVRRVALADRYDAKLGRLPVRPLARRPNRASGWHLYVVTLAPDAGLSRREVFDRLRAAGIGVNVHYIPVPRQPYWRARVAGTFPGADAYYAGAITLPLYPAMSDAEQDEVVAALDRALAKPPAWA